MNIIIGKTKRSTEAEWLECSTTVPLKAPLQNRLCRDLLKTLSVYTAGNGHSAHFRTGEGEGGEEEEWHPTSVTPLPVQVGSLTATPSPLHAAIG